MEATIETAAADYRVIYSDDNGEFLTTATIALIVDGEWIETETFHGSSEFGEPDALAQAHSFGNAFVEAEENRREADRLGIHPLELAMRREYEREAGERF
jgi:hypothetical protein